MKEVCAMLAAMVVGSWVLGFEFYFIPAPSGAWWGLPILVSMVVLAMLFGMATFALIDRWFK